MDHVENKMSSSLYALRQMSGTCSTESLKTFYFALINSHLSHGIIICIWATSKINEYKEKALRIIILIKKSDTVRPDFSLVVS